MSPPEFEAFRSAETQVAQASIPVPDELSSAVGRVRPSLPGVGRIETSQPAQVNDRVVGVQSNGSGFVVDKNDQGCLVYTKEHVVHDVRYGAMRDGNGTVAGPAPGSKGPDVTVNLPDLGPRKAQVLLADESTDSAILQVPSNNPAQECKVVPMAATARNARTSDLAIIVGYDGKTGELSGLTGIVGGTTTISALERTGAQLPTAYVVPKFVKNQDMIAIYGAAAPEGNSGGPTFNADGAVIGANHAQVGTGTLITPIDIVLAELHRVQKR